MTTEDRPAWLPEKFDSAEAMATSYAELEQKLSAPPTEPKAPTIAPPIEMPQAGEKIKLKEFYDEYAAKGEISEASYEKLEAGGYDRETVARVIQLETQAAKAEAQEIYKEIEGGEEVYVQAIEWARTELPSSYGNEYNAALQAGGKLQSLMVADLMSQFKEAGNPTPKPPKDDSVPNLGIQANVGFAPAKSTPAAAYSSQDDIMKDMLNPLYKTDPAFREQVAQRMIK